MKILKRLLPHIIAIATFFVLAAVYFSPSFNGYTLKQSDVKQWRGMSKEIEDANLLNEEDALWTDAMFGGMPAYQINVHHPNNAFSTINKILHFGLPRPAGILFIAMLGFYIFALCLRINPWLSIAGAVGFGFSTINVLYLGAGHITKVTAIAYIAPTIGGLILAFRGKLLLGAVIFGMFFTLNLTANHLQMTYYLALLLGAVALAEGVRLAIQKDFLKIAKVAGVILAASVLSIMSTIGNLSTTYEYNAFTTRGTTELTLKPEGANQNEKVQTSGLDKDYILEYNYGKRELLSIIAPNAKGEKGEYIGNDEMAMADVNGKYREQIAKMNRYWGGQRMSGGAFYFGVIMLMFALFGAIFIKDSIKWPLVVIGVLALLLASNNPGGVNDFFINKFPFYNKFRDSKMILVLLQVIIPALGVLFLNKLFFKREELIGNKKTWLITSGAVFLVMIILYAAPSISGSFLTKAEVEQFAKAAEGTQDPEQLSYLEGLKSELKAVRTGIYKTDFGRAIMLTVLALGVILISLYTKLSVLLLSIASIVLVLGDNMSVSKRYLNNADLDEGNPHWEDASRTAAPYVASPADISILEREKSNVKNFESKVSDLLSVMPESANYEDMSMSSQRSSAEFGALNLNSHYRVLNFGNPFNETNTSYFHKSIGGYHGAKLKRYQELIEFHINKEMQLVNEEIGVVKNAKLKEYATQMAIPQDAAQAVYDTIRVSEVALTEKTPVLNMLNTGYIILNPGLPAIKNTKRNGAVWFVSNVKKVSGANNEMLQLGKTDPKTEVIVDEKSLSDASGKIKATYSMDSLSTIELTNYGLNSLVYASNSKTEMPAVFSEIYYPAGWNCYIDNKLSPNFRANYALRGAVIPAGKHKIEWRFEPTTFYTASKLAMFGSWVLLFGGLFVLGKNSMPYIKEEEVEIKAA